MAARVRVLREALARAGGSSRQAEVARQHVAHACRRCAIEVLRMKGVAEHARDDVAQQVTLRVLAKLEAGRAETGREYAYVAQAARRAAVDHHRSQSVVRRRSALVEMEDLRHPADAADADEGDGPFGAFAASGADDAVLEGESGRDAEIAEHLPRALAAAPPAYRAVLEEVYFEGVPIEVLVRRELAGAAGDDARRKARQRIDKRLQRARDWVRRHIAGRMNAAGPVACPSTLRPRVTSEGRGG